MIFPVVVAANVNVVDIGHFCVTVTILSLELLRICTIVGVQLNSLGEGLFRTEIFAAIVLGVMLSQEINTVKHVLILKQES